MIVAEFNIESGNEAILSFDSRGIQDFIEDNRFLVMKNGHNHLFAPSWAGDELSETTVSGDQYVWCPKLTIIAADDHTAGLRGNDLQLEVNKTAFDRYILTLGGKREGIKYLLLKVSELAMHNRTTRIPLRRGIFSLEKNKKYFEYKMTLVLQFV